MATIIQSLNGGDPMLEPTVFKIIKSDLYSDQSGRSAESGDMLLYPIKGKVYSVQVEFIGTAAEIKHIPKTKGQEILRFFIYISCRICR